MLFLPLLSTGTISFDKTCLTREKEGVTQHLLLPGVDTVEEITLQVYQDVVTYIKKSHTASLSVSMLQAHQAFLGVCADKHIHLYLVCLCFYLKFNLKPHKY